MSTAENPSGGPDRRHLHSPTSRALSRAGLLEYVLAAGPAPVFVTGGPPRTPFAGPGQATRTNPAYAVHHAKSWESAFVLGAMLPLEAAAHPTSRAGEDMHARYAAAARGLRDAPVPVVAQVWGPMTLAATQVGLETYLESLTGAGDPFSLTTAGLEATIAGTHAALQAHPLVLWVAEPLAALVDPETLLSVWLPPMRRLLALARSATADVVVHVSGPAAHVLGPAVQLGVSGVSITADTPLSTARDVLPEHIVVFGNLDSMRLTDRDEAWLEAQGREMALTMHGRPYVATPGSALSERTPVERIEAFVRGVRGPEG